MLLYLIIVLLTLPFLDFYILIEAAGTIGILQTIGLILLTGIAGAYIVKREFDRVGRKLFASVTAKEVSRNLLEAFVLALGGVMLITPGFITDFIGFMLAFRPTRIRITLMIEEKMEDSSNIRVETGSI